MIKLIYLSNKEEEKWFDGDSNVEFSQVDQLSSALSKVKSILSTKQEKDFVLFVIGDNIYKDSKEFINSYIGVYHYENQIKIIWCNVFDELNKIVKQINFNNIR